MTEGILPGQRIAVVGAGISGLAAAWLLSRAHQVTLFEAGSFPGGHTNTVDVALEGKTHPVDTGFLVFNEKPVRRRSMIAAARLCDRGKSPGCSAIRSGPVKTPHRAFANGKRV